MFFERLRLDEFVHSANAQIPDESVLHLPNANDGLILELGKDFLYMGDEYTIQVGGRPRRLDLLFYHRALRCLVDVELKSVPFEPEFIGKMDFYLSAIDHEIKREDENPSVGIILCPSAERCEVKYAIDRTMSPIMIAEYKRLLIPEEVMKKSLEEYCEFMKRDGARRG